MAGGDTAALEPVLESDFFGGTATDGAGALAGVFDGALDGVFAETLAGFGSVVEELVDFPVGFLVAGGCLALG